MSSDWEKKSIGDRQVPFYLYWDEDYTRYMENREA